MNTNIKNNCTIVTASDYPEFFYKESGLPISEGQPVGVEVERNTYIEFLLFDYVEWQLADE